MIRIHISVLFDEAEEIGNGWNFIMCLNDIFMLL